MKEHWKSKIDYFFCTEFAVAEFQLAFRSGHSEFVCSFISIHYGRLKYLVDGIGGNLNGEYVVFWFSGCTCSYSIFRCSLVLLRSDVLPISTTDLISESSALSLISSTAREFVVSCVK